MNKAQIVVVQCPKGYRRMRVGEKYRDGDLYDLRTFSTMYGNILDVFDSSRRVNGWNIVPRGVASFRKVEKRKAGK